MYQMQHPRATIEKALILNVFSQYGEDSNEVISIVLSY